MPSIIIPSDKGYIEVTFQNFYWIKLFIYMLCYTWDLIQPEGNNSKHEWRNSDKMQKLQYSFNAKEVSEETVVGNKDTRPRRQKKNWQIYSNHIDMK